MLPYQSTMITAAVSDAANVPMVTAELPTGFPATGARNTRSPRKRKSNKKKTQRVFFYCSFAAVQYSMAATVLSSPALMRRIVLPSVNL